MKRILAVAMALGLFSAQAWAQSGPTQEDAERGLYSAAENGDSESSDKYSEVSNLPAAQQEMAWTQLSGVSNLAVQNAIFGGHNDFNEAMTRRCQEARIPLGNIPAGPHGPAAAAPAAKNGIGAWIQGMVLWTDQDNMDQQDETKYGYQSDVYGFVGGLDKAVDRWVFGIALGGSWGDIEVNDLAASTDMYNFQIGPYFSFNEKKFYVDGGVSYGATYMDTRREITALNLVAKGQPEADTWSFFIDGGYNFTFGKLTLTPIASFAYTCTSTEGYEETGAPGANLTIDESDLDTFIMRLGIRPSFAVTDRIVINAVATWNHDFCHERPSMHARFGPGNEFEIEGLRPDDDTYTLGLGCAGQINDIASVFANYDFTGGDEYDGHNLMLGFRFDF